MGLHTATHKYRRVIVTRKDGTKIDDYFLDRPPSRRWIVLANHGRVPMGRIKAFCAQPEFMKGRR